MDRRTVLKGGAAAVGAAAISKQGFAAAPSSIRIGFASSLSGPFAPGAESTGWSQYRMWVKMVNEGGGIYLKKFDRKVPVELIEYDDRSQLDEAIKLTERLILNDKVDLVFSPWGTGNSLAVAPVVNKHQYPTIFWTCTGARVPQLAPRWPFAFFPLCQPIPHANAVADMLLGLQKEGKLKGKIGTVHVAEQFGVDLHSAFMDVLKQRGIEVAYSKSYPMATSDLSPIIRELRQAGIDAFFAFSYPTDTFMLAEQSQIGGFSPSLYYSGIGTPFAGFKGKFGDKANGVMTFGGVQADAPGQKEYFERHRAEYKRDSEIGAVGSFGSLQVVQQAIERVGEIDRIKIRDEIAKGRFETVYGEFKFKDQMLENAWALGQWQNGEVVGVGPVGKPGAKPLMFPKPAWS